MKEQLYKKYNGEYSKIFPLNYIQNLIDSESGDTLVSILQSFNNIYIPYQGNSQDTRNLIPESLRRKGLWITYNNEEEYITEYYKGDANDIQEYWTEDYNWEIIPNLKYVQDNANKLPNGIITADKLSPALLQLIQSSGKVVNMADDEDIEEVNSTLKFKDRKYNSELASGKGYKILRKNWTKIGGKMINLLTQDMINEANIIYVIRYDYDLNEKEITIFDNCILQFDGGSLNNGIINFNNTKIYGELNINCIIKGEYIYQGRADEEDITNKTNILKFADRSYNPSNFSGKGYKILRKNIINDKNILTQEIINKENTVYEIRYDYDLNGQIINIPEGCTLKFEGGSIINGTIIGNNTELRNAIYNLRTNIKGTFKNIKVDDIITDEEDVSGSINMLTTLFKNSNIGLEFSNRVYKTKNTIYVSAIAVIGNNATIISDIDDERAVIQSSSYKQGVYIKDITIDCNHKNNIGFYSFDSNDIRISNITIKNFKYLGFHYTGGAGLILTNFYFAASPNCYDYCRAFFTSKPDVQLSNGVIEYAPIAIDTIGGNYSNIHIWGIPNVHNTNIGILQRHTNVQLTNIEFDSILSKNGESHAPEYRYENQDLLYKRVYHGGCGILSLMDNVSAFGSKMTINGSIDLSGYNTPIYFRNLSANYKLIDVGLVISYGYIVTKYSLGDNRSAYNSVLDVDRTNTDLQSTMKNIPNGTVIPSQYGLFNIFSKGKLYRATSAKFEINSKYTFKLCNFEKLVGYERAYLYIRITDGSKLYSINIIIYNDKSIDYKARIKIYGDSVNNLFFYINEDNFLCMYNKNGYTTTLLADIYISSIGTEVSFLQGETDKTISDPINIIPLTTKSGTFDNKPTGISVGYAYFCTDRQTSEGTTDGIMIYYKGNNIWVDALGRVVS